ncbi:hypothetical protein GCM10027053_05920 [Intrasporangium mesophilum]
MPARDWSEPSDHADAPGPTDRALDLTPTPPGPGPAPSASPAAYDPLRLCIFATVALLAWLAGPWALAFFAGVGFVGYWRARRAGLLRSRCLLGDTRLVLLYLGVLTAVAVASILRQLTG